MAGFAQSESIPDNLNGFWIDFSFQETQTLVSDYLGEQNQKLNEWESFQNLVRKTWHDAHIV